MKTTMDRMHLVEDSIRRITLEYVTDYDLLVDLERVRKNVDDTRSGLQRLQDLENEVNRAFYVISLCFLFVSVPSPMCQSECTSFFFSFLILFFFLCLFLSLPVSRLLYLM